MYLLVDQPSAHRRRNIFAHNTEEVANTNQCSDDGEEVLRWDIFMRGKPDNLNTLGFAETAFPLIHGLFSLVDQNLPPAQSIPWLLKEADDGQTSRQRQERKPLFGKNKKEKTAYPVLPKSRSFHSLQPPTTTPQLLTLARPTEGLFTSSSAPIIINH
eukprot:scaffold2897_cov178-Amphora_coffeaeformis.AAC.2